MRIHTTLLVLSACIGLSACATTETYAPAGIPQVDPDTAYQAAIDDARVAEPHEISRTLIAIRKSDPSQYWSNDGVDDHVLMVAWTNWVGFDQSVGESITLGNDVWLTVAPQVKNFCQATKLQGSALNLRLKQRLGLPPGANRTRFVELWVKPGDLFRPTPDPEINDHEASLDYPDSPRSRVSAAHRNWFDTLKSIAYDKGRRTWTRLGYTYDWANPAYPVGESQFVARSGAVVSVHSVTPTQDYCR
ncbi:MAG: hypothetical protein H6981_12645 [Gammaproteobacteria bacterium]|nr:hypothetical protein [Gammaproteobacteria bacterium]MCP5137635.1 hypothetical protein [Gammaproteobacteria bacterium]